MIHILLATCYDEKEPYDLPIFLYDDVTNTGIEKLFMDPDALNKIFEHYEMKILIKKCSVKIANKVMELIVPYTYLEKEEHFNQIELEVELDTLYTNPKTAIESYINSLPDNANREKQKLFYASYNYLCDLKETTKVAINKQAFIDKELADKMVSLDSLFNINSNTNVDIFQETPTSTICFNLPSQYDIQANPNEMSIYKMLSLTFPYRFSNALVDYGYEGKYHTPFFRDTNSNDKVFSEKSVKSLPSGYKWLYGVARNNKLGLQPNEVQLHDNLYMLYRGDVAKFLDEFIEGIINASHIGRKIKHLEGLTKGEFISAVKLFIDELDDYITCEIDSDRIDSLDDDIIMSKKDVVDIFTSTLTITSDGLFQLIDELSTTKTVISCQSANMYVKVTDIDENIMDILNTIIERGFISDHMHEYLLHLCMLAYRINWGHTAVTKAIPAIVQESDINKFNCMVNDFRDPSKKLGPTGKATSEELRIWEKNVFRNVEIAEDRSFLLYDDEDETDDKVDTVFDQYLSATTVAKLLSNPDGLVLASASSEMNILSPIETKIERWRTVNGEARLKNYIDSCFTMCHDVKMLILAFLKLLRWGEERKPTMLTFNEYPDIQTIFDLNEAKEVQNIYSVSENDLIKTEGCRYTLVCPVRTEVKLFNIDISPIVGFLLLEDYGKIQKHLFASWDEMNQLTDNISSLKLPFIDISDLISKKFLIEKDFDMLEYEYIISDNMIEKAQKVNCKADLMSNCYLLTDSNVTKSSEYIKSATSTEIFSVKDMQYDILRKYIEKLAMFYMQNLQVLTRLNTSCNSTELIELFKKWDDFDEIHNSKQSKPTHNEATAQKIMNTLNFDAQQETPNYSVEDLTNIVPVCDLKMESGLDPIVFEDAIMQKLSNTVNNCIVVLLGSMIKDNTKYVVLFRSSSVTARQLAGVRNEETNKFSPKLNKYEQVEKIVDRLRTASYVKTTNATYILDESVKGLI